MPPPMISQPTIHFGTFLVTPQVFHTSRTRLTFALVNLKPLLPGHILVCPMRSVARLHDLTAAETCDLFLTTQRVGRMIERVFDASALNVAVQDGKAAGQSVGHVHVHVIPRRFADMDGRGGGDKVYEALEGEEGDIGAQFAEARERRTDGGRRGGEFNVAKDEDRKPRSEQEMRREAEWLAIEMEKEEEADGGDQGLEEHRGEGYALTGINAPVTKPSP